LEPGARSVCLPYNKYPTQVHTKNYHKCIQKTWSQVQDLGAFDTIDIPHLYFLAEGKGNLLDLTLFRSYSGQPEKSIGLIYITKYMVLGVRSRMHCNCKCDCGCNNYLICCCVLFISYKCEPYRVRSFNLFHYFPLRRLPKASSF